MQVAGRKAGISPQYSVVRSFVASEPVSDVRDKGAGIGRPFVASENRDRQVFVLGSLKTSQSLTSNVARIRRPFVDIWMPDHVRHDGMRRHSGAGRNPG